jgi:hypothetical protein
MGLPQPGGRGKKLRACARGEMSGLSGEQNGQSPPNSAAANYLQERAAALSRCPHRSGIRSEPRAIVGSEARKGFEKSLDRTCARSMKPSIPSSISALEGRESAAHPGC